MLKASNGFTLVEIAIVMLIITLLLTGLVPTISSQIEQRQANETRKQLDEIQQALIGYALAYGRLPCPASATSNGAENFVAVGAAAGDCSNFLNGFVPAATLGIASVEDSFGNKGFAVDSWGNRIRYAITATGSNDYTKTDGMKLAGISGLTPNLLVCASSTASGFNPTSTCGPGNGLTSGVPVVIFSTGKNGGYGGTSTDEAANLDNNITFISHTPTSGSNEFDDLVVWISPNILINRMVTAGRLP
jgi:prepilin-type N-terminal cleavage/methylation domain-containing protein